MEVKQERTVDKSSWQVGPWNDEPDLVIFRTADDLHAAIIRHGAGGHLCGYVGVPSSHPWHGKPYGDEITPTKEQLERPVDMGKISIISLFCHALGEGHGTDPVRIDCIVSVHGGLTYSNAGKPDMGEDPSIWYFGFDCAHSGDLSPGYSHPHDGDQYRDIDYVKREIASLST